MENQMNSFKINDTLILQKLLMTDELTNAYNRRYFRQYLDELKKEELQKEIKFALLFLDIDRFKEFNDNYGHSCGDKVLIEVAKILFKTVADKGKVFRYAGDEFTIILPDHNEEEAKRMCKKIQDSIKKEFPYEEFPYKISPVSLSIGYSFYPEEGNTFSQVLDIADRALYYAKREGGDCFFSNQDLRNNLQKIISEWPPIVYCKELVGRAKEINYLRELVLYSRNGKGQLILIEGEAGVGKSRLIRHFANSLRVGDYNIIIGECNQSSVLIPYHPFKVGLSHAFEAKDARMLKCFRELELAYKRELIKFIPPFERYDPTIELPKDQNIDRFLLYQSIMNLLSSMAKHLPIVLILDDIHWADESSLHLLAYLAKQIENERIMICTCFREEEAPDSNFYHVMQTMSRDKKIHHLKLERLDENSVRIMIDKIFDPYEIPDEFKIWVYQESEGNPFYIEEIIKSLLDEGKIYRKNSKIIVEDYIKFSLPRTIRELILRRILKLSPNEQRILGYASIIGQEFSVDLLSKLMEEDESYILDVLDRARKAFLIREVIEESGERYAFYHNKIREAIYYEMGFIKRKKLHQRIGEMIEKISKDNLKEVAEVLAYHYSKAQLYDKAYEYSLISAEKSIALEAFQQSILYLERCLSYKDFVPLNEDQVEEIKSKIEFLKNKL